MSNLGDKPGIKRKTYEFPSELDARLKVAARARGVAESVLVRTILTDWLLTHTVVPDFRPPPVEASSEAYAAGKTLSGGNAALADVFGVKLAP